MDASVPGLDALLGPVMFPRGMEMRPGQGTSTSVLIC
jgi:hypothetical protein